MKFPHGPFDDRIMTYNPMFQATPEDGPGGMAPLFTEATMQIRDADKNQLRIAAGLILMGTNLDFGDWNKKSERNKTLLAAELITAAQKFLDENQVELTKDDDDAP